MKRARVAWLLVFGVALAGCTTFIDPVRCGGHDFACGEEQDVVFCEGRAETVEGTDCAGAQLAPASTFCVASRGRCVDTSFALRQGSCRIVSYELLAEGDSCPQGTPTFESY